MQTPAANSAVVPSLRPDYPPEMLAAWSRRHEELVALARSGEIEVAFFGDSITEAWRTTGAEAWNRSFAPLRAGNFGISGDRTQQVLWRMQHGELDGLNPKVAIVLIGTNNTSPGLGENSLTRRNTPAEIAEGVTAVVETLRHQLPRIRVLLLGIFPRGLRHDPAREEIARINAVLALAYAESPWVRFLDIGRRFLDADEALPVDLMPDALHLSPAGYEIFRDSIQEPIALMLAQSHRIPSHAEVIEKSRPAFSNFDRPQMQRDGW